MREVWRELEEVNVNNKERYLLLFRELLKELKSAPENIELGEKEFSDYFLITEDNRMNSYFVHIVPKEVYLLFKRMQLSTGDFLGFSVLVGKKNSKEVRLSCFGVPCELLTKELIKP